MPARLSLSQDQRKRLEQAPNRKRPQFGLIFPSPAIEAQYRARLLKLVEQMQVSIEHWLVAEYRRSEPELSKLAQDASPAVMLRAAVRRLAKRWQRNFNRAADQLARYFATDVAKRSDSALQRILRKGGYSIQLRTTRAVNDVLQAAVAENVALIKSIPQQYLVQVEGMVMRSVQAGRDLESLVKDLRSQFGVTKRRAHLIARDQNNKLTSVIQRTRQLELGITEAIWVHSGAGKHPRPTHVKAGAEQVRYSIKDGWYDPAIKKRIWPGTEINCRCVGRPVVPGFV